MKLATLVSALALALVSVPAAAAHRAVPPPGFVLQALCVHSGWWYAFRPLRPGQRPYASYWGHLYFRVRDVPDGVAGGSGEGRWHGTVGSLYGGGMSFMLGTWNRVGGPPARSVAEIASAPPPEQIRRAWLVWLQDGHSWREWPQTSAACGFA